MVVALWNPSRDVTTSLEVDAAKATLVNAMGETREIKTEAGPTSEKSRNIRVQLHRGSPVYVVWSESR